MKEEISNIKKSLQGLEGYRLMIKGSKNQVTFMAILSNIDANLDDIEKRSKAGLQVVTFTKVPDDKEIENIPEEWNNLPIDESIMLKRDDLQ